MPKRKTIQATSTDHLKSLVKKELRLYGPHCDLNHIDVSAITEFSGIFKTTDFNGNVSKWDTSKGLTFKSMFEGCPFNCDISQWDTSQAFNMAHMFSGSKFNGDVSRWSMPRAQSITGMFQDCPFAGDLSAWNLARLDAREGNRFVAHIDPQARHGLRLPLLEIPAPVLFNTTPATMHEWLALAPHSRYHWDALLVGEAPWANTEMVEHLHKMRPLFELLGLSGVALAQKMEESWGAGDAPTTTTATAWSVDFESPT